MTEPRDVDLLVVATHRRWVATELAAGSPVPVVSDLGLDAPDLPGRRVAWWTPTEHAARLLRAGIEFPALSPGADFLVRADSGITGRSAWVGPLSSIADAPRSGWAKPAEAKVETLPAAHYDDTADFAAAAQAAGLPQDAVVQVSADELDIVEEHRMVVEDGRVTGSSWYLVGGKTYDDDARPDVDPASARAYATEVLAGVDTPPGCTLDVGLLTDGRWVVIEANPIFSSALYGADPSAFVPALLASFDHDRKHPEWAWRPDPYLTARADRLPLLRTAAPTFLDSSGSIRDLRTGTR